MEEKLERKIAPPVVKFEKKNTAPSITVDGLDLTDKPVTIFHLMLLGFAYSALQRYLRRYPGVGRNALCQQLFKVHRCV